MPQTPEDDIASFLEALDIPAAKPTPPTPTIAERSAATANMNMEGDDPLSFLEKTGLRQDREIPEVEKPWMKHHKFTLVHTVAEVNRIVDECISRGSCSLDLETQGLDNRITYDADGKPSTVHKIVGYCISYDGVEGFYIPVRHRPTDGGPSLNVEPLSETEAAIKRLCMAAIPDSTPETLLKDPLSYECLRPRVVIYFWNAQFDHEFLYPITGIDWWHPSSFEDGMLASFVKYANDKAIGLKPKSRQLLADPDGNPYEMIELKELFQRGMKIHFDRLAPDDIGVLRYAGSDAICTYKLCQLKELVPLVSERHSFTYRIEKQVSNVLRVMERYRVFITKDQVELLLREQESQRAALLTKIQLFARTARQVPNLDPNSPKQLGEFLFGTSQNCMDITPKPEKNEASGQYKTDSETLEGLAKTPDAPSILKDIVAYRGLEKSIGTYLTSLVNNPDHNSELRFSFKQTGAGTGRFSAPAGDPDHGYSGLPIHGIPAGSELSILRRAFQARPGYTMVKCDYAGEELRIAANVSNEQVWIDEFLNGSGDLHTITARAFFGKQEVSKDERSAGKTANFALLYGGGPKSIVRATGCEEMEARRRKQAFDKAVPTFAKWIKGQHASVKRELGVRTAFDRWLPIPDANSIDPAIRAACERHSVNFVIQGSGADIMKISLILLHKEFYKRGWLRNGGDDSVRMLLTVHDEIVFEIKHDRVAEAIPIIVNIMESPWHRPKTPRWRVPLIVEPLVGFNWSSGFKCERVTAKHPPGKNDVVMNGFAYGTTRKPRMNKKDEIIETLDINEVLDGKVFRVLDAPWLCGRTPGETPTEPSTPASTDPTSIPVGSVPTQQVVHAEVQRPLALATPVQQTPDTNPKSTLVLGINQLNDQTVNQVFHFVWNSLHNDGPLLHLTDIVGETLIPTTWNLRVNEDELIANLRKYNLLHQERDHA